jgi:hypothetical protein
LFVILSAAKNPRIGLCLFLFVILAQPESPYLLLPLPFRREQGALAQGLVPEMAIRTLSAPIESQLYETWAARRDFLGLCTGFAVFAVVD